MAEAPAPQIYEAPQGSPFRASAQVFSPPWLMRYVGSRLVMSQSVMWDALAEFTRYGVLQRFPTIAQPDALGELGKDRKIWRGLGETDDHYASRLQQFKRTWKFAGNAPTLLRQLWEYLKPDATRISYVVNGYDGDPGVGTQFADWWTIDDTGIWFRRNSPSNWNWDDSFGFNIRFWIIVSRADLITPADWGVPPYDWAQDGLYWGADPFSNRDWIVGLLNIVDAFKASGSHMGKFPTFDGGLIVADSTFIGPPWGGLEPFSPTASPGYPMPDGTFADASLRPPGAVYIGGL